MGITPTHVHTHTQMLNMINMEHMISIILVIKCVLHGKKADNCGSLLVPNCGMYTGCYDDCSHDITNLAHSKVYFQTDRCVYIQFLISLNY